VILRSAWLTGELDSELAGEIFLGQGTPRLLLPGGVALFGAVCFPNLPSNDSAGCRIGGRALKSFAVSSNLKAAQVLLF
jgi:hypothetical protein